MTKSYIPLADISTRWDFDTLALLMDRAFTTRAACDTWRHNNWSSSMLFGVYLDSTYELDFDDPSEFCYIEGSLGGIGHLAIVGGHKWKDAFPDAEQKVFKLERPKHA